MFRDYNNAFPQSDIAMRHLSLVRMFPSVYLKDTLENNKIRETINCEMTKRNCTYLAYGRPGFYKKPTVMFDDTKDENRLSFSQVCLLINSENIGKFESYFFDTGAFFDGVYQKEGFLTKFDNNPGHESISIFKIGNSMDDIMSYICILYSNMRDYYEGNLKVDIDSDCCLLQEIVSLAKNTGNKFVDIWGIKGDLWHKSVEIQALEALQVEGVVEAMIVSDDYRDQLSQGSDKVFAMAKRMNIKVIEVESHKLVRRRSFAKALRSAVRKYYNKKGVL